MTRRVARPGGVAPLHFLSWPQIGWPVALLLLLLRGSGPLSAQSAAPASGDSPAASAPSDDVADQQNAESQPSVDDPPTSGDESDQMVIPLSDAAIQRIEEALRLQEANPEQQVQTGDPILDEVIDVIRRQGSVLDGSSLDTRSPTPQAPPASMVPRAEDRRAEDRLQRGERFGLGDLDTEDFGEGGSGADARFYAAESLLRSARMLQAVGGRDAEARQLISMMRERATVLLLEEFTDAVRQQP